MKTNLTLPSYIFVRGDKLLPGLPSPGGGRQRPSFAFLACMTPPPL